MGTDRPTDRPTDKAGCSVAKHATKKERKTAMKRQKHRKNSECVGKNGKPIKRGSARVRKGAHARETEKPNNNGDGIASLMTSLRIVSNEPTRV